MTGITMCIAYGYANEPRIRKTLQSTNPTTETGEPRKQGSAHAKAPSVSPGKPTIHETTARTARSTGLGVWPEAFKQVASCKSQISCCFQPHVPLMKILPRGRSASSSPGYCLDLSKTLFWLDKLLVLARKCHRITCQWQKNAKTFIERTNESPDVSKPSLRFTTRTEPVLD